MLGWLEAHPLSLPPLVFGPRQSDQRRPQVDTIYEARWAGRTVRFVAELRSRSTPQALIAAAHQAKSLAFDLPGTFPLVVVPYLSPAQLDLIESLEKISAIDLCGNGIVRIGDDFLVFRSGQPNQFREVRPIKAAYRGTSSLLARALAIRREFSSISEIHAFIVSRGGRITMGTVSKTLKRLAEDLIIERKGNAVRVIQPDKLLEQLRLGYRPPRIKARWTGKILAAEEQLHARFLDACEVAEGHVVLTGIASARYHVAVATEPIASFYCSVDPQVLLRAARFPDASTRAFPNVELLQTEEPTVYFDPQTRSSKIISSPVQTWLELVTGDKRSQEASEQLRTRILNSAGSEG